MRMVSFFFSLFLFPVFAHAATLKVPGQYPTIQDAIDASVNGDTVLVEPGTYVENIDFLGKAITVKSEQGPTATIIDGGNPAHPDHGSVAVFQGGEGYDSILEGFMLANGSGSFVPGIPGYFAGGGIYCGHGSYPTITGNIIAGNKAFGGGGIHFEDAFPHMAKNTIHGNSATYGGGIFCGGDASLSVIIDNIIDGNSADWSGGGIFCLASSPTIANNIIKGNTAKAWGGGISCDYASPGITGNTLYGNSTDQAGGGIRLYLSSAQITNTILWNDKAPAGHEVGLVLNSTLNIEYSDVEDGQSMIHVEPGSALNWGAGMIDSDPLFFDPANGDFHLKQDPCQPGILNPCVDSGGNLASNLGLHAAWTRTDQIPDSGVVDMGFHYGPIEVLALTVNIHQIPEQSGGAAELALTAGLGHAFRSYVLLGSISGTSPGTILPGGNTTLPLNWDLFTNVVIDLVNTPIFSNFMGTLDGTGSANATFDTLISIPGTAGLTIHFAYALNNPWNFASNPVEIRIVP